MKHSSTGVFLVKHNVKILSLLLLALASCGDEREPTVEESQTTSPIKEKSNQPLSAEQVWALVSPSVVRVEAEMLDGKRRYGSGFACTVGGKPQILSNKHVVLGAKCVWVGVTEEKLVKAPAYRISADVDLTVVDLPDEIKVPLLTTRVSEFSTGTTVYALGFPLGLNKSITQGLVSSQTDVLVQFNAAIASGSSGGPLVDSAGRVLAVVTAGTKPGNDEVAQNLNFAIKTAFVPEADVFQDPIVSFYDAWLELVDFENHLITQIQDLKILELEEYLGVKFALALFTEKIEEKEWSELSEAQKEDFREEIREQCDEWLEEVEARHGSVEKATENVIGFLEKQVRELDELPELFAGLGNQELLHEFLQDDRPGGFGLLRLDVDQEDLVPLLRLSIEHAKASYEDMAFRIGFLQEHLSDLRNPENALTKELLRAPENETEFEEQIRRKTIRVDYSVFDQSKPEDLIRAFLSGGIKYWPPEEIREKRRNNELPNSSQIEHEGGFEGDISQMFQRMALEAVQKTLVEKAIGLIANETQHRNQPSWRLAAFFEACNGNYSRAYDLYLKGFQQSKDMIDPFSLERNGRTTALHILSDVNGDGSDYWTYSDEIRSRLKGWNQFVESKPAFALKSLPSLNDVLASQRFWELDDLQKALVFFPFYLDMPTSEFMDLLDTHPRAKAFYYAYLGND